jgi:hypothetical protein
MDTSKIKHVIIGETEYSTNPLSHSIKIIYKNGNIIERNMSKYNIYKYFKKYIHYSQIKSFENYIKNL